VAKLIDYPLLGMDEKTWSLIFTSIYAVLVFLPMFLNYQYIFFSDDGEYIVLRYFSAGITGGRKNSVEIDKRTFSGYKIEKRLLGLSQSIILFQKINNGTGTYPPIYISALDKVQRAKLVKSLNKYVKK